MRNILKKTAVATAVGALCVAGTASASDFVFDNNLTLDAAKNYTVVFAEHMFGEGNGGTINSGLGSENTAFTGPEVTFEVFDATPVGDTQQVPTAGNFALIRFTLSGTAHFAEDLQSKANMDSANGGYGVFHMSGTHNGNAFTAGTTYSTLNVALRAPAWEVTAGGGIGDNTVTIRIDGSPGNWTDVQEMTFAGYKVKNLKDSLKASSPSKAVTMGVEYNEFQIANGDPVTDAHTVTDGTFATTAAYVAGIPAANISAGDTVAIYDGTNTGTATIYTAVNNILAANTATTVPGTDAAWGTGVEAADDIDDKATDTPLTIFGSQPGLDVVFTAVDFNTTPYTRINVGATETMFTGGTTDGRSDFDIAGDTTLVNLGTLQLQLQQISTDFPMSDRLTPPGIIKKESGDNFDFQGGDLHRVTLGVTGGFATGGSVFLSTMTDCSTIATGNGANLTTAAITAGATTVNLPMQGNTTELTTNYQVCYQTAGSTIPEATEITAAWEIYQWQNDRWDIFEDNDPAYGPLLRNGCIASFFNIPPSDNASDTAYIRLTNTSITNEGNIRGSLFSQTGDYLPDEATGKDKIIWADDLERHATQVFYTGAADVTTAHGETIVSLENAFGIAPADYKGRGRLVLKGAFDTCEGLGLIRNSETGALYNMTATTQGNEAAGGNDGNNAQ